MRKLQLLSMSLGLILTIILTGCGVNAPGAQPTPQSTTPGSAEPTSVAVTQPVPTQAVAAQPSVYPAPEAAASAYPAPTSPRASINAPDDLLQRVRSVLAQKLGMAAEGLTVQEATQQQWPNGALGCPDPAKSYTDVLVPGYKLLVSDGQRSYAIHTTLLATPGEPIILCENGMPQDINVAATQPTPDQNAQQMIDLASKDLATFLSIDVGAVNLEDIQPVDWNDSSLGCAKPGENYSQVITPGYFIRLKANEQTYEYHTDKNNSVVRCLPS